MLPEAVQIYSTIQIYRNPTRKFTKKYINTIIILCFDFHVFGNKGPILAALDEAVSKNPEKPREPDATVTSQ